MLIHQQYMPFHEGAPRSRLAQQQIPTPERWPLTSSIQVTERETYRTLHYGPETNEGEAPPATLCRVGTNQGA